MVFLSSVTSYAEVEKVVIIINGMACPVCAYGVEKKLKSVKGVKDIEIDIQNGLATLTAKEGQSIEISQVPQAIEDSGFRPDKITATASGMIEKDDNDNFILKSKRSGKGF